MDALVLLARPLQDGPERVLRTVPLEQADLPEAEAFVARTAVLPSVRDGRRRWAVVRAGEVVSR